MNKDAKNEQNKNKFQLLRPWVGLNHQPSSYQPNAKKLRRARPDFFYFSFSSFHFLFFFFLKGENVRILSAKTL
jgi:hypothetical protein